MLLPKPNQFSSLLTTATTFLPTLQFVRNKWPDHRMIKDAKRRGMVISSASNRLRVNAMRRNDILPAELREIADTEIKAFPLDTSQWRLVPRCVITSKPRGVVYRWRLSRMVFRSLVDYNKLGGVQRAMW